MTTIIRWEELQSCFGLWLANSSIRNSGSVLTITGNICCLRPLFPRIGNRLKIQIEGQYGQFAYDNLEIIDISAGQTTVIKCTMATGNTIPEEPERLITLD